MTSRITWIFLVGSIAPLFFVYASFLYWWYQNPQFLPSNSVEMIILDTQVARALTILSIPRFRNAGFLSILDVFTLEILSVPAFIALSLYFGGTIFLNIAGQIIWAWPPAFIITFLPISMYKLASMIRGTPTLSVVLPSVVGTFVTLAFLMSATTSHTSIDGLMGISKLLIAAIFGSAFTPSTPYVVSLAGIVLFLVLTTYAVSQGRESPPQRSILLVFGVLGATTAICWELTAAFFATTSYLWVFGVPALVLVGLVWGITRAR